VPGASAGRKLKEFPIPELNSLVARHFRATQSLPLTIAGRPLPLVYLVVATLIAAPQRKAVAVLDFDGRFDMARVLRCPPYQAPPADGEAAAAAAARRRVTEDDLAHVHVFRPAAGKGPPSPDAPAVAAAVAAVERHMLYGAHGSRDREYWGVVVVGGAAASPDVAMATTWKGWLRVDREELLPSEAAIPAGDVLAAAAGEARRGTEGPVYWVANSLWGGFRFQEA